MINGLGERLQEQRTTHKLSQREVALALNVSPTVISNYEKGVPHGWNGGPTHVAVSYTHLLSG